MRTLEQHRFGDALAIDEGACNPSGIAYAIISACAELRDQGAGTAAITRDPAIRLMVNQLSYICGNGEMPYVENHECRCACKLAVAVKA